MHIFTFSFSDKKITEVCTFFLLLSLVLTGCNSKNSLAESNSEQVAYIIRENGCLDCHSTNAKLPFYGNLPVIGTIVKADITVGTRYLNLDNLLNALENEGIVSEVDMAKVENTAISGSMPPLKYSAIPIHWGSALSKSEKSALQAWAKGLRKEKFTTPTVADEFLNEPVQPLMDSLPVNPAKVALGYTLFHDTRLSADNTISCSTCHDLKTGGVDRKQFSEGIRGQLGGVNAPTVYNAALNFKQFWDGRAADLQEQAAGPPLNPVEMGHTSFDNICAALELDEEFNKLFSQVYPEGLTEANITDAIAEFEKTLLTPSRFDQYLKGNKEALTQEEKEGYDLFKDQKCATCHVGVNLGGQSFEYIGIKGNYFDNRGTGLTDSDLGRYAVTKNEADRHFFKTPTLRNVMITQPYMHDGSISDIKDAVRIMQELQVGQKFTEAETTRITLFLHSLTGEFQGDFLQ